MQHFTEYELFIIHRIAIKNRWCDKHICREDLLQGRKISDLGLYGEAIDSLVTKGILKRYKSKGREDYCLPKPHRNMVLTVLKENAGKFDFIDKYSIQRIK